MPGAACRGGQRESKQPCLVLSARIDQQLPGLGLGGWKTDCLMGIGFLFGVMKVFYSQIVVMVVQHSNVLKATEIYMANFTSV